MKTAILIPARLQSSRLTNKMLVELDGVPLIKRVYDACVQTDYDTYVVTSNLLSPFTTFSIISGLMSGMSPCTFT